MCKYCDTAQLKAQHEASKRVHAMDKQKSKANECRLVSCHKTRLPGRRACAEHTCRNPTCTRGYIHNDTNRNAFCGRCKFPKCAEEKCDRSVVNDLAEYTHCKQHQTCPVNAIPSCAIPSCVVHMCTEALCIQPGIMSDGCCYDHSTHRCGSGGCRNVVPAGATHCDEHACRATPEPH